MKKRTQLDTATAKQAVDFVYANLIDVSRIQMFFPIVLVAIFWNKVNNSVSLLWCAMSVGVYVARILLTIEYRQRPDDDDPYRWGRLFTATSLVSGILWGLSAFLFDAPESASSQILVYVLIVGTAAGASIISSYWMPGYLCFAVPAVSLASIHLVLGDSSEIVLGIVLFLYLFILIGVAKKTRQSGYDAIALRFENMELIKNLESEKERAETANRAKTQFLASANHDLRQPVHALSLLSYSIKDELNSDRGRKLYRQLDHTVGNLNSLLASLLDLSQLDADALKVELTTVHLDTLAAQLQSEYSPIAAEKNLVLRIHRLDASIKTDHTLILRLIGNLLSNAIRYTNEGGILLGFRRRGENISIEVWDTGIGIAEDQKDTIFNEFYQIETSNTDSEAGLGLGLSICQRIAKLLDTRIHISSIQQRGSVFKFSAPETASIKEADTPVDPAAAVSLENTTVLVIDDDLMGLNAVAAVLSQHNTNLLLAQSSERAMELLDSRQSPPDLILSDFRLAGALNGVELVNVLRNRPNCKKVPAVIMTGDTAIDVLAMLDQSNLPVLNKPISATMLIDTVNHQLLSDRA